VLRDVSVLQQQIDKYAWVNEIEAWTVAVIEGCPAQDVIRIYGGNPDDSIGDYLFAQMSGLQGPGEPEPLQFHVQVIDQGRHVVAIENNGWTGSLPEIARRCSVEGGRFFSVYWNVNAYGTVAQAVDGEVTAYFSSLYPISSEPPQPGDIRPEWAIGPGVDVELAWPVCFALLEEQTGVAFDPKWLSEQRPTYTIPDPHWMLRDVENADRP
jgi:hypothetical protein